MEYSNDFLYALEIWGVMPPKISTLPTEIIEQIFEYIRNRKHMGSACLVCRRWRDIMQRQMWETLTTSLRGTSTRHLYALYNPQSGILTHVRRLIIRKTDYTENESLRALLELMPRDSLKEFKSLSITSPQAFKDLFVWQTKLERFDAFVLPILSEFGTCDWILPFLSGIKSYKMLFRWPMADQSLKLHKLLFRGMSRLEQLNICFDQSRLSGAPVDAFVDIFSLLTSDYQFSRLQDLVMSGINIASSSWLLLDRFDISKLHTLRLRECIGITNLLNSMSDWYTENTGQLHTFEVIFPWAWVVVDQGFANAAVERFLTACPSLWILHIEHNGFHLVHTDCIARHGHTLQTLMVGTVSWLRSHYDPNAPSYSVQDLEAILEACQHLSSISLDMPMRLVNLGPLQQRGRYFQLAQQKKNEAYALPEFESVLSIISDHPNIRRIRMLNLPKVIYSSPINLSPTIKPISDQDTFLCGVVMHQFAHEVFNFLADRNSTVQFLDICPTLLPPLAPSKDINGHQWPVYAYQTHLTRSPKGNTLVWAKTCKPPVIVGRL